MSVTVQNAITNPALARCCEARDFSTGSDCTCPREALFAVIMRCDNGHLYGKALCSPCHRSFVAMHATCCICRGIDGALVWSRVVNSELLRRSR